MKESIFSPSRFDQVRAEQPSLGLALYAMDPGGVVTFEVYTPDGQTFSFVGASADEAVNMAFPVDDMSAPANSDVGELKSIFD